MRLAVVGMKQRFATLQDFDQSRQVVVLVLVLVLVLVVFRCRRVVVVIVVVPHVVASRTSSSRVTGGSSYMHNTSSKPSPIAIQYIKPKYDFRTPTSDVTDDSSRASSRSNNIGRL